MAKLKRRRILEEWNNFRREMLPADCPQYQMASMQVAYYGGASALFLMLMSMGMGTNPEAHIDEHHEMLDDLQTEFNDYGQVLALARRASADPDGGQSEKVQ